MSIPITLDEKIVTVEVAVLNQELDYNILLGRTWIDEMEAVVSSLFGEIQFFHLGHLHRVKRVHSFSASSPTIPLVNIIDENQEMIEDFVPLGFSQFLFAEDSSLVSLDPSIEEANQLQTS